MEQHPRVREEAATPLRVESDKAMSKVVEQPPRVREESATPPRVESDKAMSKVVQPPPRVRKEATMPPRVDGDRIAEAPRCSKQECEAYTPARYTRDQRRTLTQELI